MSPLDLFETIMVHAKPDYPYTLPMELTASVCASVKGHVSEDDRTTALIRLQALLCALEIPEVDEMSIPVDQVADYAESARAGFQYNVIRERRQQIARERTARILAGPTSYTPATLVAMQEMIKKLDVYMAKVSADIAALRNQAHDDRAV